MSSWLETTMRTNRMLNTYVKGFVDVSGGGLIMRNGDISANGNMSIGEETTMNGNVFINGKTQLNADISMNHSVDICGILQAQFSPASIARNVLEGVLFSNDAKVLVGTVIPWANAAYIPQGYAICDGQTTYTDLCGNVQPVPDLRGKFIIGYDAGDASFGTVGSSGEPLIQTTNLDQNTVYLSEGAETYTGIIGFDMSADTQVPYYPPYYTLVYIICIASVEYSHAYIDLIVTGDLLLYRGLNVSTDSSLNGTLSVGGDVTLAGITELASTLEVAGDASMNGQLDVGGNTNTTSLIVSSSAVMPISTPSSASDTGTTGQVAVDTNYVYVCTATDTWKRAALSTW